MKVLEQISEFIESSKAKYKSWYNYNIKGDCPDCGFWVACPKCSEYFSKVDIELRLKEGKPVDYDTLKRYGFIKG